MINKIVDGISEKLNSVFGDEYEIYSEQVKQGLKEPCFFIALISSRMMQIVGNRYDCKTSFVVQYFPASVTDANTECYDMQGSLFSALEYITVDGDLQRGIKMRGELVNGILHFFVDYHMIAKRAEMAGTETEYMEEVEADIEIGGG